MSTNGEKLTAQEVFTQVSSHLLKQKRKAINEHGCAYRGEDGTTCAAGCMIRDDEYKPVMEMWGIEAMLDATPLNMLGGPNPRYVPSLIARLKEHSALLMALQNVHDRFLPHEWAESLRRVARDFKLNADHITDWDR